jgi:tetratricopeptide (TPR) repeat protein
MDESPRSRMTFRQAISGQWQIPLFAIALAGFVVILWLLKPMTPERTFEQKLEDLSRLAGEDRYYEFYQQAEFLRQTAEDQDQLGLLYGLAAQTRVRQLQKNRQLSIESVPGQVADGNYQAIINDYRDAMKRNWPGAEGSGRAVVFHNLGLAFWSLRECEQAMQSYRQAIEGSGQFNPQLHRELVQMLLISRPEGYLEQCSEHLEKILSGAESTEDDKAWAFVRKAEVLIAQGQEDQMFAMLEQADSAAKASQYNEELEFLRGRALRKAGQADQAELILRELMDRTRDRGDLYAQIALELGKINYEQYRDYDARQFYQRVVNTQAGKDWCAAGILGLAECEAMRQHYSESLEHYREVVDLLQKSSMNRAVDLKQVQNSVAIQAENLGLYREYDLALRFLEIEQQIAPKDDIRSAYEFARMNAWRGNQLWQQLQESRQGAKESSADGRDEAWTAQQQQMITNLLDMAGRGYMKVVDLAIGDKELYGDCLWQAATCYDKAGATKLAIDTWQRIVREQEDRPMWPMAMFNLAQAYQAIGEYQYAIGYYRQLLLKHPKSPAAFSAMVPLAQCHLSKEPPESEQAEGILKSVLVDLALTPQAPSYRQAMFVLGDHYYRNEKYDRAINILTEAIDRYSGDPQLGKSMFLVADSYRQSGLAMDKLLESLADDPTATLTREKTADQRRRYLENAREYFDQAMEFFVAIPESQRGDLENVYLRQCYLYRADCLFDLGRYREAIQLYEAAVMRYQLTPTALGAFVQIVNCHLELGNSADARFTNERAVWQLRKIPDDALAAGPAAMTRQQWNDWFDWLGKTGLW